MEWKRKIHAAHGTVLIETYSYENVDMGPPQSGQQYRFDERPPASNMDPYSRSQPGRY